MLIKRQLFVEYRDLLSVATHELGHSMGLGHSSVQTSVMYPYYMSNWKRVELDADDIAGMQKIYGEPITTQNKRFLELIYNIW